MKNAVVVLTLALLGLSGSALYAGSFADDVASELQAMKAVYSAEYAPALWKKKFANYDLNTEFNKALAVVQGRPNLTRKEARDVFKNFIYSMKDYHTSISFVATEQATLPFVVKGTDTKEFIVYIDRTKLPESAFPFHVGDELVTFDGKPVLTALAEVQAQIPANVPSTDKAIAEVSLTSRRAARGYDVPQGPVTIGVRPTGMANVFERQLSWEYTTEEIHDRSPLDEIRFIPPAMTPTTSIFHPMMDVDVGDSADIDNPYNLGTKVAWTPTLGKKIWQSDASDFFYAYTYITPARKIIGYIRIASYMAPDFLGAVAEFQRDMAIFESTTDGMIIDQVNNPGGSVFYLYALASMLTDKPLFTPKHRMTITQADVATALAAIAQLKNVKTDADAKRLIPVSETNGYPVTFEFAQFSLNFAKFIVSEWNAGRRLTNPNWIEGVDHINPAPMHYSKPILLLINQLDFSGGDFFPAILQDNKRVTIFGSRTAGAGGYVNDVSIPNNVGVDKFRCTGSIAERIDQNPIENLGVKPDIEYSLTELDLRFGYSEYVKAVQKAILDLIK